MQKAYILTTSIPQAPDISGAGNKWLYLGRRNYPALQRCLLYYLRYAELSCWWYAHTPVVIAYVTQWLWIFPRGFTTVKCGYCRSAAVACARPTA